MSIEAAITFTIAIFIFGITPGPGIFAILARALNSGAASCVPLSFGMAVSDVIYLILATFGLAAIAQNYAGLFMLIRFVGAAYLMYLGWKMWTAKVDVEIENGKVKRLSWLSGFIQGFLISASNPKVILFYIGFNSTVYSRYCLGKCFNLTGFDAGFNDGSYSRLFSEEIFKISKVYTAFKQNGRKHYDWCRFVFGKSRYK